MSTTALDPGELEVGVVFGLLTAAVAPRPIALVSTVDAEGVQNLAPFSFFNTFGANPPVIGFSPSRRVRDGTTKDTLHNLEATGECVVHVVTHGLVEQVNLASAEFPSTEDEWARCGLTAVASERVAPPRVAESPVQMECRLQQIVRLGEGPGSGNLCLCEVVRFHVATDVLVKGRMDSADLDLVGRLGGAWYVRAEGAALFAVRKPRGGSVVGWDALPTAIRESPFLSANDVARLAVSPTMPTAEEVHRFQGAHPPEPGGEDRFQRYRRRGDHAGMLRVARHLWLDGAPRAEAHLARTVHEAIVHGDLGFAWCAALGELGGEGLNRPSPPAEPAATTRRAP